MFEFTETVAIHAPPDRVWARLSDLENWWLPSNPEHLRLEVRAADKTIGLGTEIVFEERVAGVAAKAVGAVTSFVPGVEATWEGTATYRYFGLRVRIQEGVTWGIRRAGDGAILSARVWALFPRGPLGRLVEWYARAVLNVIERDRMHARHELEYLKRTLE